MPSAAFAAGTLVAAAIALLPSAPVANGDTVTIQNSAVAFTIDHDHGCSVSAAWAVGDPAHTNLINTADLGRYVQASYYSGPASYDNCEFRGQAWPWNPIAAGDLHGNPSALVRHSESATQANCTIVPMQWACDNVPCECTVEYSYEVVGSMLTAAVKLNNNRKDHTAYPARTQEIPAVYVNGFLDSLWAYEGSKPCTGDTLTNIPSGWSGKAMPWVPGVLSSLTEPWLAFTQANNFGLGVWSKQATQFIAGFSGKKGAGGTKDEPTGYIAPLSTEAIAWDSHYEYTFALIMGNLPDIRNTACALSGYDVDTRGLNATATAD